jgi:hypothetical protein
MSEKAIAVILLSALVGCGDVEPSESVARSGGFPIQGYDMKDGVRCYVYPAYAMSCVQVKP